MFNGMAASSGRSLFRIHSTERPGVYELEAGEAYGITPNAEFAIYSESDARDSSYVGHVVVDKDDGALIDPFKTMCRPLSGKNTILPTFGSGYALQTRIGDSQDLVLSVDKDPEFHQVFIEVGLSIVFLSD